MNVILTDEAIEDLIRIGQFIQQDNPTDSKTICCSRSFGRAMESFAELAER